MLFFSPSMSNHLPWGGDERNSNRHHPERALQAKSQQEHYNLVLDKDGQWNWTTQVEDDVKHLVSFSPFLWHEDTRFHQDLARYFIRKVRHNDRGELSKVEREKLLEIKKRQGMTLSSRIVEGLHREEHELNADLQKVREDKGFADRFFEEYRHGRVEQSTRTLQEMDVIMTKSAHCIDFEDLAVLVRHALQVESLTDWELEKNTNRWLQDVFPVECDNHTFDEELLAIPELIGLTGRGNEKQKVTAYQKQIFIHCFISDNTNSLNYPSCWKNFAELYFSSFSFYSVKRRILGEYCNVNVRPDWVTETVQHEIENAVEGILNDEDIIIGKSNLPTFDPVEERDEIMKKFQHWISFGDSGEVEKEIGASQEGDDFEEKLESYIQAELKKRKTEIEEEIQDIVDSGRYADTVAEFYDSDSEASSEYMNNFLYENGSFFDPHNQFGVINDPRSREIVPSPELILRLSGVHCAFVHTRELFLSHLLRGAMHQIKFNSGSDEEELAKHWIFCTDCYESEASGEREELMLQRAKEGFRGGPGSFFNPFTDCLDVPWYSMTTLPLLNWDRDRDVLVAKITSIQSGLKALESLRTTWLNRRRD